MKLVTFDVSLEVLSPLHIGTGEEMAPDADFVVEQGPADRTARIIDVYRALAGVTPEEIGRIRDGRVAAALGERSRQLYTKAIMPIRGQGNVTRVRLMQRLTDGRPYIPGTTVKGSIRTALLLALVKANPALLARVPNQKGDQKRADDEIEEAAFAVNLPGRSQFANRDLNRAIRVSDFLPEGEAKTALVNMSAHRLGGGTRGQGAAIPIWCEAIEPGSRFSGSITVELDSPLWRKLPQPTRDVVNALFRTWFDAGQELQRAEAEAWQGGPRSVVEFLAGAKRGAVVLGWGGGWRSKTLGIMLDQQKIAEIARRYGLRRWQGRDFPQRFPVTRKLAQSATGLVPPGWVRVTTQKRKGGAAAS